MELGQETLRRLLDYDPETGALTWRERPAEMFADGIQPASRICRRWNSTYAGKAALAYVDKNGYRAGNLLGRAAYAHRVIWKWMCGADPDEIDHVNGIRSDNRFNNLRNVDHAANTRNVALHSSNTSGVIGVSWAKRECRWRASIKANNRERHIGYFRDFEDAVAARKAAERQFGFHKNHGRLP